MPRISLKVLRAPWDKVWNIFRLWLCINVWQLIKVGLATAAVSGQVGTEKNRFPQAVKVITTNNRRGDVQ